MNKEEFDRAMEGADLIEQRRLRREMDAQDQQKQAAAPGARAIGPLGGIIATFAAAALLPAFGHALWLIGLWSWNLIG